MMQVMDELRKRQKAITGDFKSRAQKAETILGEIEACETKLSALSESLSTILGIGVKAAAVAAKAPKAKAARVKPAKVKAVEITNVKPVVKPTAGLSLKDQVRDFLVEAGKPMKIAEIVSAMKTAGHVFLAKKPVAAMSLLLYGNRKMFKRVKRGTFVAIAAKVQQVKVAKVAKVPQVKASKVKVAKPAKAKPAAKRNAGLSQRDSVREFMLKAGKPMRIAEIVQAMQKAGQAFQAKRPIKAMTKLMYNNAKVFKRVKPGTFKAV